MINFKKGVTLFATSLVLYVLAGMVTSLNATVVAYLDKSIMGSYHQERLLATSTHNTMLNTLSEIKDVEFMSTAHASVSKANMSAVRVTKYTKPETIFEYEYAKYSDVDKEDIAALAVALYCEARGESWYGIAAVADTIRNRKNSDMFPNTYRDVVTQYKQFSCIEDKDNLFANVRIRSTVELDMFKKLIKLAHRTATDSLGKMTYNALFYHTTEINPYWAKGYNRLEVVGNHIFYTTTKL